MLELTLLGGFEARCRPSDPIVLPTRKARALLAYLALHPDEAVSRQSLAALLWSDRAEPQANNSLSQALSATRKVLAGASPPPLIVEPDSLKIIGAAVEVDVLTFERLVKTGGLGDLEHAERLYQGELLQGIAARDPVFEEWLEFERRRLHALAVGALTELLALRRKKGQRQELVATAQRLLRLDPLQESTHRALMRCYAEQGQTGLALDQYQTCADVLKRELGIEPDAETKRVREEIVRRRPASWTIPAAFEGDAAGSVAPNGAPDGAPDSDAAVASDPPVPGQPLRRRPLAGRAWRLAALFLLLAALGATAWLYRGKPAPEKPSIVVLPFSNISATPEQESFADGMTEDLITDLAKISGIFVISRNTSMAYKGQNARPRQVAGDLGVRYVLEGSVRRAGDRLRINARLTDARLTDAESEGSIWAETYDGTTADVFALQDKITEMIVNALALELLPQETGRVGRIDTGNVQALDAFNMGRFHYYRRTPEDNARAPAYFERAIELDPDYGAAYTALAKVYAQAAIGEQAYADALGIFWTEGYTRAARLLEKGMAQPNADSRVLRSWLSLRKHQNEQAVAEAEAALTLSPNDADALEALAEALIYMGRPRDGIVHARKAMDRNPLLLGRPLYLVGLAEFALGNPEKTIEHLERAIELAPARKPEFSGILAAAYGELGREAEAQKAFDIYEKGLLNRPMLAWSVEPQPFANPRFHTWRRVGLAWAVYAHPFANRETLERLAQGFATAGATSGIGGFLPLHAGNRLTGSELRSLLFGATLNGKGFWLGESTWRQERTIDGSVQHSGYPVHAGLGRVATGNGRIEGDRLCDRWSELSGTIETCVAIYRVPDPNARLRWGDYVMVTDTGPHPFSLAE